MQIPSLQKQGSKTILTVDGRPFVAIAGEIHNSDYTSIEYMEHIFQNADDLGMNTLLIPMSWDIAEPEEGVFDFSLAGDLIAQARRWNKKIVFLWFGSFKNAECMYAPGWVKRDLTRFKRAQIVKGENKAGRVISPDNPMKIPYTSISYLSTEGMEADGKAFAKFMEFLKAFDADKATVIAVQVENETGLLGAAREVSDEADAAFAGQVPAEFVSYMKAHTDTMVEDVKKAVLEGADEGCWSEVFGPAAEEIFSAYHVASYVNFVAQKGKDVYPLPMSANCWLDKGGEPGSYPTGGPVSRVHEVWDFCAPAIDLYCPDIYVPNFIEVCDEYTRRGNALFIPEAATHSYAAPRLVYTIGHHHAICYSPFGFDDIGKPFTAIQGFLFGMDVTDPALKTPQNFEEYRQTARYLTALLPLLAPRLGSDDLQASCAEAGETALLSMAELNILTVYRSPIQTRTDGYALALQVGEGELYLMGNAVSLQLTSRDPVRKNFDLLLCEELLLSDEGALKVGRRFNGDETSHFGFDAPGALHLKYFLYE